jgi:hypothetical protein
MCLVRGGRFVGRACDRIFDFFYDPERAYEEVDDALKECWFISFDAMADKEQDPSADKKREADSPVSETYERDPHDDDGDSHCVHHLVPGIGVLVVVLRHELTK